MTAAGTSSSEGDTIRIETQGYGMKSGLRLHDIPEDVLLLILALLEVRDLLVCKQVCSLLRRIIETDVQLQYIIELGINGVVEGPAAARISMRDRLAKLRVYGERWCTADFQCEADFDLAKTEQLDKAYSLSSWIPTSFGYSISYRLQRSNSTLRRDQDEHMLVVYSPPSAVDDTPARRWCRTLPLCNQVVAVDLAQDLVIIHETESHGNDRHPKFHFLSMETWEGHPNASRPVMEGPLIGNTPTTDNVAQVRRYVLRFADAKIYGRHVAWIIMCFDEQDCTALEVWDWQKGRRVWHGHFPRYATYTFLDSEHIAVMDRQREGDILIYHFSDPVDPVQELVCTHKARSTLQPDVVLKLPVCAQWCMLQDSAAPTSHAAPAFAHFWPDPQLRIVPVSFTMAPYATPIGLTTFCDYQCILLVPYHTFRKHIQRNRNNTIIKSNKAANAEGKPGDPLIVHWEDWGPQGSLLLKNKGIHVPEWHTLRPIRYHPFGSRISILVQEQGQRVRVLMFDMNPLAAGHNKEHTGCRRVGGRGAKTELEDFGDVHDRSCALEMELPRVAYEGPVLRDLEMPYIVALHQHGFMVVCTASESVYRFAGMQAFYV